MVRTQIYLTEREQQALRDLSRHTGRTQSDLIREAVDQLIARSGPVDRVSVLQQARGLWRDRADLPDFAAIRRELDRSEAESEST